MKAAWISVFAFCAQALAGKAADVPGSKDHPLVTRFPKSQIVYFLEQPFAEFRLNTSPLRKGESPLIDGMDITGKVTRIQYSLADRTSVLEVYGNYKQALEQAGFNPVYEGSGKDGLGTSWVGEAYKPPMPGAMIRALMMTPDNNSRRYMVTKLTRPEEGDVYVQILVNDHKPDDMRVMLDVIETQPMKKNQVVADAGKLAQAIMAEGHVVVEGIYFDTAKATLKPESAAALEQMARLLTDNPTLAAYVVGHTDATGSFSHNMELSQARARSVVSALIKNHQITAARLEGHGAGPLSPVAANTTEAGRARNRRVELVARGE